MSLAFFFLFYRGAVPKGYIYFAMGFSVLVELLNLRVRRREARSAPVGLHQRYARSVEGPDQSLP